MTRLTATIAEILSRKVRSMIRFSHPDTARSTDNSHVIEKPAAFVDPSDGAAPRCVTCPPNSIPLALAGVGFFVIQPGSYMDFEDYLAPAIRNACPALIESVPPAPKKEAK